MEENFTQYLVGVFNLVIAVLAACNSFLKYNIAEDVHRQYSRQFDALKLELDTTLAQDFPQNNEDLAIMIEKYRERMSNLLENSPDLEI